NSPKDHYSQYRKGKTPGGRGRGGRRRQVPRRRQPPVPGCEGRRSSSIRQIQRIRSETRRPGILNHARRRDSGNHSTRGRRQKRRQVVERLEASVPAKKRNLIRRKDENGKASSSWRRVTFRDSTWN